MTMYIVYFNLICLFISTITCNQVTDQIDFERDCDTQMIVTDYTVVEVFASPQAGVIPDSASCQAKFVGKPEDRKLRIYVQEFFLGPGACGHKMKIYDGDPYQNDPKWELGCNTPVATYTSSSNEIILSFVKPTIDTSQLYKFNIKITTDRDEPYLLFEPLKLPVYRILQHRKRRESGNVPSYTDSMTGDPGGSSGGGLTSGAIAGIAVGCVVGAVIIIAICIYALWKFMRQAEEKKRYGHSEPPPAISVISSPSTVNGILKHPGSGGSTRSKSTKSRGFDNDAFSDTSETKNSRYSEKPIGDQNGNRYDEEMGRGSYSRRGREKSRYDEGHQNPGFDDDLDYSGRNDRYGDRRQSYKRANEEAQSNHINLRDLGSSNADRAFPLSRPRKYGDESSRTESSFQTETTNRTYSDSSHDSRDDSVSYNPGGRKFRRNEREGSVRRSRSRTQSMSSSKSGNTRHSQPRSASAERADQQTSQAGSHQSRQHGSHHAHRQHNPHHHHRGSSGSSRRKKQPPPDAYLPIFNEVKKSKRKH